MPSFSGDCVGVGGEECVCVCVCGVCAWCGWIGVDEGCGLGGVGCGGVVCDDVEGV